MSDGDVQIILGHGASKKELTLRPSLGFIKKLDQKGVKLMPLLRRFQEQEFGLTDMAMVVQAAAIESIGLVECEELIFTAGCASVGVVMPLVRLITNALNGGRRAESEDEAQDPQKA